jgi:HTH-type transcriptional regulator, transcriptional repressor of NAD biosynthesis genes
MTRGMLLGKFMPPHRGHEYMIDFARRCVDELTVLVCSIRSEPIPGELRYAWMREHFGGVRIVHCTDENPQEPQGADDVEFWAIWRASILSRMEPPDVVFASEPYGVRLAAEVGARFMPVDPGREVVPISASQIRADAKAHWEYLLPESRPHYVQRVVLVGPESSGKSTLTKWLARHFGTQFVPEYGRTFQENIGRDLVLPDMLAIAQAHRASEDAASKHARQLLFVDTEAIVTRIWSRVFFDTEPEGLEALIQDERYHLYLLAMPHETEWHQDGWRLQPEYGERLRFAEEVRQALENLGRPYEVLTGSWEDRQAQAVAAVEARILDGNAL